jgi:SulP family sulfate permease
MRTSASFSRSALNLYAGARTGWAALVTVLTVWLVLLWLTPTLFYVPYSVLAAVVIAAVSSIFKPMVFLRLWRVLRVEALTLALTFAVTVITPPRIYWGVLAGVLMVALRMDAELDFAAANSRERRIFDELLAHPDTRHVCLFAQPINRVDATGIEIFSAIRQSLLAQGVTLHLSGMKLPVETLLRGAQELPDHALLKLYRTDAEALYAFAEL